MTIKRVLALTALAGTLSFAFPAAPARANGAASTRNLLLLGGAAAAYLIIEHNRKVHEKYAQDAQRQAELQQQNNNEMAAYRQERRAYREELTVNAELKKEIAYQHSVVLQERKQLAALNVRKGFATQYTAARYGTKSSAQVAMASYGWGTL
jgi:predicted DNA repair protein MutK